jgi:hypothetical protein
MREFPASWLKTFLLCSFNPMTASQIPINVKQHFCHRMDWLGVSKCEVDEQFDNF